MLNCTLNLYGGIATIIVRPDKPEHTKILKDMIEEGNIRSEYLASYAIGHGIEHDRVELEANIYTIQYLTLICKHIKDIFFAGSLSSVLGKLNAFNAVHHPELKQYPTDPMHYIGYEDYTHAFSVGKRLYNNLHLYQKTIARKVSGNTITLPVDDFETLRSDLNDANECLMQ